MLYLCCSAECTHHFSGMVLFVWFDWVPGLCITLKILNGHVSSHSNVVNIGVHGQSMYHSLANLWLSQNLTIQNNSNVTVEYFEWDPKSFLT